MDKVVTEQPQIQQGGLLVTSIQGHRNWSTGLFDCFTDIAGCVKGMFCLSCTMCGLSVRLGDGMCMPCCVHNSLTVMRSRVRTLGGIQGTMCSDCMVASCCTPCAVCQLERELDNMGVQ